MPRTRAIELLRKHNLPLEDVRERKASLHHLRDLVRGENLPFDVFRELVRLRR